jgi:hypothetical protein
MPVRVRNPDLGAASAARVAPVLPYPSYLRVYEPAERALSTDAASIDAEQHLVLSRAVSSTTLTIDNEAAQDCYVLRRGGRDYVCPVDLSLRSWLSLTSLVDNIGDAAASLIFPANALSSADDQFLHWRRDNPDAVPHIRTSTWGVPRTWFVLVVEDERELYDHDGATSVRYRAAVLDARRRATAAHRLLRSVIDDGELLDDLADLGSWLEAFDEHSLVELDYAGVARLLQPQLSSDQSARDIHRALDAVRRSDFATAAAAYRTFEERWRSVNAFERAN